QTMPPALRLLTLLPLALRQAHQIPKIERLPIPQSAPIHLPARLPSKGSPHLFSRSSRREAASPLPALRTNPPSSCLPDSNSLSHQKPAPSRPLPVQPLPLEYRAQTDRGALPFSLAQRVNS